jgi:hypothetical protein
MRIAIVSVMWLTIFGSFVLTSSSRLACARAAVILWAASDKCMTDDDCTGQCDGILSGTECFQCKEGYRHSKCVDNTNGLWCTQGDPTECGTKAWKSKAAGAVCPGDCGAAGTTNCGTAWGTVYGNPCSGSGS